MCPNGKGFAKTQVTFVKASQGESLKINEGNLQTIESIFFEEKKEPFYISMPHLSHRPFDLV